MGQGSAAETVAAIFLAFVEQRTWRQAELAQRIGVSVPWLRRRLLSLQTAGMPLERDDETPQVYWSVPRGWFPGGIVLTGEQVVDLLPIVLRAPKSKRQQRVLRLLAGSGLDVSSQQTVVTGTLTALEDSVLGVLEQGAATKTVTRLRYQSHSDAVAHWRHVSVQRVMVGQPVRFVGLCHKATQLRWYRLDRVSAAELAGQEPWQSVSVEVLDKFISESVGGFHGGETARTLCFSVRDPESRWVADNLPAGWQGKFTENGLEVQAQSASLHQVARFVVSLGEAALCETNELQAEVQRLALGALHTSQARLNIHSVATNESSLWDSKS
ncbi:MAG TPA: WYL domain-containing protein [Polyangiaceae bacterium]|nr:WYL domain-containing protein [Polyangiaceae bacterium]